ncbi:translation initiation factor eIF-2B subunit epsilon-like [Oppia nitens]|uniref:translation initiation factor eIF-2B subunit epsilon-like n=1 Tax=Oppia nitens TaxID=1686743 RepID=UPI0023DB7927|nr:translation initiation factor eIF-2B subunit epsilon-like [Oppia nitens]XP_054162968.1 translation initiation factor eIF-2B subunit epsilon-like [Oppia nitens]
MSKKSSSVAMGVKQEDITQAVIIADSFTSRFKPITNFKPKVLLPLVNRPLLEYTLEFLNNAGIDETFIFSCSHWQQIKHFVADWQTKALNNSMTISVFASESFQSMGDALRELDAKAVIKSDFILINGDSIGTLPLKEIRAQHKANRLKDKGCVMTTVFRRAKPNHRIRSLEDEFVAVVDSETNKILHFERILNNKRLRIPLSKFQENQSVDIHHDLQDTHISICSINVPPLFTDNFDYETRDHFIDGILVHEELLGNSIYAHTVDTGYCARVNNVCNYDRISKDVLQRFTHPMVPDMQNMCTYQRHNIYKKSGVHLEVDTTIKENVAIGENSSFGNKTYITDSTIGSKCKIGNNVRIDNSYIWDNVTIEDNCVINHCIIADNVYLKPNVTVNAGSLISYNVVLGPNINLKKCSYITYDPDDESDNIIDKSIVGNEGRGWIYKEDIDDDDSEEEKDIFQEIWGESEDENDDEDKYTTSTIFSDNFSYDEREDSPIGDDLKVFYDEVSDSLQRGIKEKVICENLILEINSSKHAYNVPMKDLNILVMKAILDLPNCAENTDNAINANAYFDDQLKPCLVHLLPLIKNYIKSQDSQNDCIDAIEEYCLLSDQGINVSILAKTLHYLYFEDVLKEDTILEWHKNAKPLAELSFADQENLRKQKIVLGLIKWLEEAEEESSTDDED